MVVKRYPNPSKSRTWLVLGVPFGQGFNPCSDEGQSTQSQRGASPQPFSSYLLSGFTDRCSQVIVISPQSRSPTSILRTWWRLWCPLEQGSPRRGAPCFGGLCDFVCRKTRTGSLVMCSEARSAELWRVMWLCLPLARKEESASQQNASEQLSTNAEQNQRAEERAPRSSTQTSRCWTVQRNQRATEKAPSNSTKANSCQNVHRKSVARKENSAWDWAIREWAAAKWAREKKSQERSSGWDPEENEDRWSVNAKASR